MAPQALSSHNQRLWIAYRHDLRIRNLSEQTVRNYFEALRAADSYFGAPLDGLGRLDIKAWLADELSRLKDTTVHNHFVGLRVFYNWMIREELITKSPMTGVDAPQVAQSNPVIPTDADLKALLKACSGTSFRDRRDNAMFRLMLEPGGPRRAEIVGIGMADINVETDLVRIMGKGSKERFMPYGAKTGQALMRYMHVRASHRFAELSNLWVGRFGGLTLYSVAQILETRCEMAGITRIKPHALRHASADRAMAAGISDLDMQTLFGWSSPAMLAVYARSNRVARAIESAKKLGLGDRL